MVDSRKSRDEGARSADARPVTWTPPQALPTPKPEGGWVFRWVRSSLLGNSDTVNMSAKFREGWEPVSRAEFEDLKVVPDVDTRFPDKIEVGGLILCKAPVELTQQRRAYQQRLTDRAMQAVDENYMREGDPRMPLLKPERRSRISAFGND